MSLRARLALLSALLLGAVFVLGGIALERLFHASLMREIDVSLQSVGEIMARDVARGDPYRPQLMEEAWLELQGVQLVDSVFQLLDRDGRIDLRSRRLKEPIPVSEDARRAASEGRIWLETIQIKGVDVRILYLPVFSGGRLRHLVQIGTSLTEMRSSMRSLRTVLLTALPFAVALAGIGAWWLAGLALAPVDRITQSSRSLTAKSLHLRLTPLPVKDELGRLVDTLNEMIGRLEGSFEATRRFSADASHELRTPLTVLRGELELALRSERTSEQYRDVLTSCLEEVGKLSEIVADLLFLSRTEGALRQKQRVDLNDTATEVVASLMPLAREHGLYLRLNLDPNGSVTVEGDEGQLGRMLRNLVENAIFYTSEGGVQVEVGRGSEDAVLTVRDTGVGISAEHQSRVFSRFYRVDFARTRAPGSSGLGLSIVKQVAEAHGGRVELESALGRGSRFTVRIPLAPTAPPGS